MDEAAEAVVSTDLADGRRWLCTLRWEELEGAVRPVRVVVVDEDAQNAFEVAAVEDQQPVQTFDPDGSDETLGDGVCCGARTGVLTIRMPPLWTTSSKVPLYLLSRSRIRNRMPWSARSRPTLRACWVTQAPVGLVEQPASQTRRLACAMKNST